MQVRQDVERDEGFTLVETLVAMIVFAILMAAVAGLVLNMLSLTESNSARVVAANLATQQIEETRAKRALDVLDGATVRMPKPVINGTEYTVTQTSNYVEEDSTTDLCSSGTGARLAYRLVTVEVTWPDMAPVEPVRQDTLLSLGIGFDGIDDTKGIAAVGVVGAEGQPQSGVLVTLNPSGAQRTTGADGCAVFPDLVPATYTARVDQAGWVGVSGAQLLSSAPFGVAAKQVTRASLSYARAGALSATFSAPQGLPAPATLGATLTSVRFSPVSQRPFPECASPANPQYCLSGSPRTAAALFPGLYGGWAGTCTDAAPATPPDQLEVGEATTTSITLPLAGARASVRNGLGQPAGGYTVYARHGSDASCTTALTYPMAGAGGSDQSLALPAGTWTFSLTADGSGGPTGGWPTATLSTGSVASVVVTVP